jgi:hypothetical protein
LKRVYSPEKGRDQITAFFVAKPYCNGRTESDMLKNATESADYYPDSRKRRHDFRRREK